MKKVLNAVGIVIFLAIFVFLLVMLCVGIALVCDDNAEDIYVDEGSISLFWLDTDGDGVEDVGVVSGIIVNKSKIYSVEKLWITANFYSYTGVIVDSVTEETDIVVDTRQSTAFECGFAVPYTAAYLEISDFSLGYDKPFFIGFIVFCGVMTLVYVACIILFFLFRTTSRYIIGGHRVQVVAQRRKHYLLIDGIPADFSNSMSLLGVSLDASLDVVRVSRAEDGRKITVRETLQLETRVKFGIMHARALLYVNGVEAIPVTKSVYEAASGNIAAR